MYNPGTVSHEVAKVPAAREYEKFRVLHVLTTSAISKSRSSKSEPDRRLKKRPANDLASFFQIRPTHQFPPPQTPVTASQIIFISHPLINLQPTPKNPHTSFLDTPR